MIRPKINLMQILVVGFSVLLTLICALGGPIASVKYHLSGIANILAWTLWTLPLLTTVSTASGFGRRSKFESDELDAMVLNQFQQNKKDDSAPTSKVS